MLIQQSSQLLREDPVYHVLPGNVPPDFLAQYTRISQLCMSAMKIVITKLEILDDEFRLTLAHNPIHHVCSRLKTAESTYQKLLRKGGECNFRGITEQVADLAGIRIICPYIDDVYGLCRILETRKDLTVLRKRDYIASPKANGYRSLHLVVEVPVSFSGVTVPLPVEIQLRTIAMDFWASLEHELRYKSEVEVSPEGEKILNSCAEQLAEVDDQLQSLFRTHLPQQATAPWQAEAVDAHN